MLAKVTNKGIALLMVTGSITILLLLLFEFTFQTKIHTIKNENFQNKVQAKYNAESGLALALARLHIYQTFHNFTATGQVKLEEYDLSLFYTGFNPTILPIPVLPDLKSARMNAIKDFQKQALIQGTISVTIRHVSRLFNVNDLRNKSLKVKEKMVIYLEKKIEDKKENDPEFSKRHMDTDPQHLIDELAYFVNDKGIVDDSPFDSDFIPKYAPMTSFDEMYLLPSWDDEISHLIKEDLAFTNMSVISVNELTKDRLEFLFPEVTTEQSERFFKHLNGDPDENLPGQAFVSLNEFKNFIVDVLQIVSEINYEKKLQNLKKSLDITLGMTGKLFLITSEGSFKNATYKMNSYVDLPVRIYQIKPKGNVASYLKEIKRIQKYQMLLPRVIEMSVE